MIQRSNKYKKINPPPTPVSENRFMQKFKLGTLISRFGDTNSISIQQHFLFKERLGSGKFSNVISVISIKDQKIYAIKESLHVFKSIPEVLDRLKEIQAILNIFNSEITIPLLHIVNFYAIWENQGKIYSQIEYCNSKSLQDFIDFQSNLNDISDDFIWDLLYQISLALTAIHEKNYVHLDLKPENILIHQITIEGNTMTILKLGDFGLLKQKGDQIRFEGDAQYLSPEILQKESQKITANFSNDLFSLGATLYRISSNVDEDTFERQIKKIQRTQKLTKLKYNIERSPQIIEIINALLDPNPNSRLTLNKIFQIEKIQQINNEKKDLYQKLINFYQNEFSSGFTISNKLYLFQKDPQQFEEKLQKKLKKEKKKDLKSKISGDVPSFRVPKNNFMTKMENYDF
ncbi:membrane-associated tyrosine- and threonine-specific cdc2-inhibitory kinase [Anaeramoeba ignava]|uniref:Membrane-associated tyrosine- and threonine-specific cdc2-inhibitory kinase n=1 Tax=Anaeramoeba ignava TaxID=1746090 RepID=A0A9Q0L9Q7_ANAIG|nr:membrane-associated tyrosine- and threonine-specific cdc2-inhibitory kinase [Anaeramoeba ignava]